MTALDQMIMKDAFVKQICNITADDILVKNQILADLFDAGKITKDDIEKEFEKIKNHIAKPKSKPTNRNLPREIKQEDLEVADCLTIGKLRELLVKYNLPDDGKVLVERVEDYYFEENNWGVVYKNSKSFTFGEMINGLSEDEKRTFLDQFHPAWYASKFKDDDKNLYICLHY